MAFDREIAALTVYCEASGEPHDGKVAVAATFFNRLKAGRFGKTVASVCLHRYQYSEWNDDKGDNSNLIRGCETPEANPVMADCLNAYDEALAGADPSLGATHYYAVSIPAPDWAATGTETIQIGHHLFFKDVP